MNRNVALIVLDSVRTDVFRERASRLQSMADCSVRRCYAASHYTLPSHASMFTGDLPSIHGVTSKNPTYAGLSRTDTFLAELPHTSVGVTANGGFLSADRRFDTFFDRLVSFNGSAVRFPSGLDPADFVESTDEQGIAKIRSYLSAAIDNGSLGASLGNALFTKLNDATTGTAFPRFGDYGANAVAETAVDVVESEPEPVFLFTNLIDAHGPLDAVRGWGSAVANSWYSNRHDSWDVANGDPPAEEFESYLEIYREIYADAVEYLDRRIAAFVRTLKARTDRDTTVVVTADHGEELGYPGEAGFGHRDLSAPILDVPLVIINAPDGELTSPMSHLDLPELLVALATEAQIPDLSREYVPAEKHGHIKTPEQKREYWNRSVRAVIDGTKMYRWDTLGASERFELEVSAGNLTADDITIPSWAKEQFPVGFNEVMTGDDVNIEESDVSARLRDLGYL